MSRSLAPRLLAAGAAALGVLATVVSQSAAEQGPPPTVAETPVPADASQGAAAVPFGVGERSTYEVRFGALKVGSGSMEVVGTETIRGRETFHTVFRVRGGTFFYKVDDRFESWFDQRTLYSLRYIQDQQEGQKDRERHYEIFPEREAYVEQPRDGKHFTEKASVKEPLDDGSFIYFIRTVPLTVGQTYEFHRYFRPDRNPVRLRVLRKERITVPAGTFDAIVVQPSIKAKGIFGESGQAQVWFSDDTSRVMLQLKSKLSIGSINMHLTSYRPAGSNASAGTR